jgi:hypothetical protein
MKMKLTSKKSKGRALRSERLIPPGLAAVETNEPVNVNGTRAPPVQLKVNAFL